MKSLLDNEAFSQLLLGLYRAAANTSIKEFRHIALSQVQRYIPYDGVIWTTTSMANRRSMPHVWVLGGVSREMIQIFKRYPQDQMIFDIAKSTPGEPQLLRIDDLPKDSLMAAISAYSGMRHVMITAEWNETLGAFGIVSVGRRDPEQPFTAEEVSLKRLLMPHLEAMVVHNFESQIMASMVGKIAGGVGLAIFAEGTLVLEEPNFVQLVQHEWPAWLGPSLPDPLLKAVHSGKSLMLSGTTRFHLVHREDQVMIIATSRSALDVLTHKEHMIASEFAEGKSYKEVARTHSLSPETVRSRLRSVYEKLSIGDKAELSQLFAHEKLLRSLKDLL